MKPYRFMYMVTVYTLKNEVILSDFQWFEFDYILFVVCWYHVEINPQKPSFMNIICNDD